MENPKQKNIQKLKDWWRKLNGKKTYISALALLAMSIIKHTAPEAIPLDVYEAIKNFLEILLYGSATHGIYKTFKNK